jgi:predicted NBD/HSP70 family sugar kinase
MTRSAPNSAENTRSLILDLIRSSRIVSRVELAERSGLTGTTITRIVKRLIDDGLVVETGLGDSTGGKRPTLLELNVQSRYAIGLSIDDARLSFVLTDFRGNLIARLVSEGVAQLLPAQIVDRIVEELDALLSQLSIEPTEVLGLGVANPGRLDADHHAWRFSRTSDDWESFAIKEALHERTGLAVTLENDSRCAALAEFWVGRIPATHDFATVYMATGIGCGLMIQGNPYRGASDNAGAIAHTVIDFQGPPCWCGARGCVEVLASPAYVVQRALNSEVGTTLHLAGDHGHIRADFSAIARAAAQGHARCVELIEQAANYLAVAVVSMVNLLDLDQVFLAGPGFADAGSIYLRVIRDRVAEVAFMRSVLPIAIDLSDIGPESAAIGGAALVLQEHLTPHHALSPR